MLKKLLAITVTTTLLLSIIGVAMAEFDYSVFENYEEYKFEVEFDLMDDTGRVNFPVNFKPFKKLSDFKDFSIVASEITSMEGVGAIIRVQMAFNKITGAENIIFLPDKTRYTIGVMQNYDTRIEADIITFIITPSLMPMFREIVDKKISSVRIRIDGTNNLDGFLEVDVEQLKTLLDLYDSAGGVEQMNPLVETIFPVTIK